MVRFVRSPRKKEKVTAHWRLLPVRPSFRPSASVPRYVALLSSSSSLLWPRLLSPISGRPPVRPRPSGDASGVLPQCSAPLRPSSLLVRSIGAELPENSAAPIHLWPNHTDRSIGRRTTEGRTTRWNGRYARKEGKGRCRGRCQRTCSVLSVVRGWVGADYGQGIRMFVARYFSPASLHIISSVGRFLWQEVLENRAGTLSNGTFYNMHEESTKVAGYLLSMSSRAFFVDGADLRSLVDRNKPTMSLHASLPAGHQLEPQVLVLLHRSPSSPSFRPLSRLDRRNRRFRDPSPSPYSPLHKTERPSSVSLPSYRPYLRFPFDRRSHHQE